MLSLKMVEKLLPQNHYFSPPPVKFNMLISKLSLKKMGLFNGNMVWNSSVISPTIKYYFLRMAQDISLVLQCMSLPSSTYVLFNWFPKKIHNTFPSN